MKNTVLFTILLSSLGMLLFASCGKEEKKVVTENIRPVKYGKVANSSDALSETFSGTAQSSIETTLSFKVSGTIKQLNVKVGDLVEKGKLIARVDPTDYSVQYQQSVANMKSVETQIRSAKSQLVSSKATYDRIEKLYENNSVSLSDFEQAKSGYELAQASYNAAVAQAKASEKQVESARNQVNYANLAAPFSGVITAVNVEENELISIGAPVAIISAISHSEISVGMPEIYISKVKKDQPVKINLSAMPGQSFSGKVYEVGYSSLGGSTYPVTLKIDHPTEDIRPGMAADVRFNFGTSNGNTTDKLVAPVAAVGEDSNGHFVFGLIKDGDHFIARKQLIQIGELTPAGFEIKSGLKNGDLVATAGLDVLLDGMKVRLLDQK